jgi:hypothetical protein
MSNYVFFLEAPKKLFIICLNMRHSIWQERLKRKNRKGAREKNTGSCVKQTPERTK